MSMMIKVGMADLQIASRPDKLITYGLGSCIGACIYDEVTGLIGMSHFMLPTCSNGEEENFAKYAESAIPALIQRMMMAGARRGRMVAKIAGGAQMFGFSNNDMLKVGLRNTEAAKQLLGKLDIPIIAEDTGGNYGRTIEFDSMDGSLTIKALGKGIRII